MKTRLERLIELRQEGKTFDEITDIMRSENYTLKSGAELSDSWAQTTYYAATGKRKVARREIQPKQHQSMVTLHEPAARSKVVAIVGEIEDVQELLKAYL
jgi:hypothetical protein